MYCYIIKSLYVKDGVNLNFKKFIKSQSPARIIALGFAATIFLGSFILMLPISLNDGVNLKYVDSLYTATSAVCVTGLVTVDPANTFTPFGRCVLAALIQIGGLGVTSFGTGMIIAMGKKLNLKSRNITKEALNLDSRKGIVSFIKEIFLTTLTIELLGAFFSFFTFRKKFSFFKAVGISLFHSIAAFNNSGFDILGNFQSLSAYKNDVYINIVTCFLIFFGGIGFYVIKELRMNKFKWKPLSMHSKVVLSVSMILIIFGTIMLKLTENITWLGALFNSVSARTAGFSTFNLGDFSNAGLIIMMVLMFIGASPGSTAGGIKKAAVITVIGITVVLTGTFLMSLFEPNLEIKDIVFEIVSAYGTVGDSTGITPSISTASKILSMLVMFIGRLGPMTIVTLWYFSHGERVRYPEGNISIG